MIGKKSLFIFLIAVSAMASPSLVFSRELESSKAHKRLGEKNERATVTARLIGQLGNNLFEVAAATALALDNNADTYFSQFTEDSPIYKHVFFRCKIHAPKESVDFTWGEPSYSFTPIRYAPNMQLWGFFQSEKYFAHHRDCLLELFAPHPDDVEYMNSKYAWLIDCPNTVGVQLRYYKGEDFSSSMYPQYGRDYLEKAMALFPASSMFVVSSNNLEYARRSIPSWVKNVFFIEGEPNYIDLYLLSFCKDNIISNSSFGWWSAWLNRNPDKIVVAPSLLFYGLPTQDYCPEEWVRVDAAPDRS